MNILENLLVEQTRAGDIGGTRPHLVQMSKTVASRVFRDMVAIQESNNPHAQVFGLKFLTENDKTLHNNALTVTGASGKQDIKKLETLSQGGSVVKGKLYKTDTEDAVYIALKSEQLEDDKDFIIQGLVKGTIRLYSDAAEVEYFESENPPEVKFEIGKWVVPARTRKVAIRISQELVQDLEANDIDSVGVIENTLSQAIVNEVNKDIISKLITVSKRFNNENFSIRDGFIDMSSYKDPYWQQGRDINAMIGAAAADMLQNTTYSATYVIVSPNVYGLLCGAGLVIFNQESEMTRSHGYLKSGLKIYIDTYNKFDYFLVGCKHNIGIAEGHHNTDKNDVSDVSEDPEGKEDLLTETEYEYVNDDLIGSLYYTPYLEEDGSSIYVVRDSQNLSNNVLLMTRYGLSVNPFTIEGLKVNQGDDWDNLIGKSNLSVLVGIKLS